MQPSQIAVLTLMLLDNTELGRAAANGSFHLPDQHGLLSELRTMLTGLKDFRCQLQANHASNYFALDGRLPKDKERFLATVDLALSGAISLKSERMRGL
jgi:hypothetical protein